MIDRKRMEQLYSRVDWEAPIGSRFEKAVQITAMMRGVPFQECLAAVRNKSLLTAVLLSERFSDRLAPEEKERFLSSVNEQLVHVVETSREDTPYALLAECTATAMYLGKNALLRRMTILANLIHRHGGKMADYPKMTCALIREPFFTIDQICSYFYMKFQTYDTQFSDDDTYRYPEFFLIRDPIPSSLRRLFFACLEKNDFNYLYNLSRIFPSVTMEQLKIIPVKMMQGISGVNLNPMRCIAFTAEMFERSGSDVSRKVSSLEKWEKLFAEAGVKTVAVNESKLTFSQYEKLSAICEIKKAASELFAVRAFKEGADLEAIKKAQSITDAAYKHILPYFKEGVTENEIVSEMIYYMRKQGAAEAFDTIVLFGPKTAVPHGVPSDVKLQKDVPVLLDFGAKYAGFCSDMSRSFFFGRPTEEYAAAYDAVLGAQTAALAGIKAGMTGKECDAIARDVIEKSRFAGRFTHSLGHGVGVEIHEWPNFAPRFEGPIPEGSVLSVEPGVYLSGRFGVRIEDIVRVEKDGVQNLTKSKKFSVL